MVKRTVIASARIANVEGERKTMKKNLIDIYSYFFGKSLKFSLVELIIVVLMWHNFWNLDSDSISSMKFLLYGGLTLGVAILITIISASIDKHLKKVQLKYLNSAVNLNNNIKIDVEVGEDVSKEEMERIKETLIRVNHLLDKKSQ